MVARERPGSRELAASTAETTRGRPKEAHLFYREEQR